MKQARWILSLLMALVMVLVTIMPAFAVEGEETTDPNAATYRRVEAKKLQGKLGTSIDGSRFDELKTDPETEVTAIIIFGENGANDLGEDQNATKAVNARKAMANRQNTFVKKMNAKFSAELLYNYTVLADGVAVKTKLVNLKEIEAMEGVKAVYIANEYGVPKTETPDASTAADITGAGFMQQIGYSGEGILVAVLDTGLNTTHEAFQDYGITEDTLTEESAAAAGTAKAGKYLSAKVPFSYDYADDDDDVTDNNGHGTHVCGIATGYVAEEDGAVTFYGAAPAAQLLMMKIFKSAASTTNSGIYFAALEDAYLLGVDVINMSIGSDSGFVHDYELDEELFGDIYQKLEDEGVIVSISAGNDTNLGMDNISLATLSYGLATVPTSYQDYGVVGSPSTYNGNESIASMENAGYLSYAIELNGNNYPYNDSAPESGTMRWYDNFAGQTLEYVKVGGSGLGSVADFAATDVVGKVAVVRRGDFSFEEKVENAYNAGAIGCIVYNNAAGVIGMQITTFEIPAVSVTQDAGAAFDATGSLTVTEGKAFVFNPSAFTMSTFSSWGVTPSLTLKPTLTAIGGMLYAPYVGGDDAYDVLSGTSMASPNAAGSFAVLVQALREVYPDMTKKEIADMAEDLLKSTAYVATDSYDYEISPRSQGAGLIDLWAASQSPAYIKEPILNIGDGIDQTNQFQLDFEVVNTTNATVKYGIYSPRVLFPYVYNLGANGYVDSLTSDYVADYGNMEWTSNWDSDIVEVAPYDTAKVSLTISFVEGGGIADMINTLFENGTFIEGYVYLQPLEAELEYFEIEFPEADEAIFVPYGETLEDYTLPEIPFMYGTRGGEWDVDVTAPILADAEIYAKYNWILYGDATCGGEVDAADASAVLRHLVKLAKLTEEGIENATVTKDFGTLKAADAAAILRKGVKLIDKFPIELRNDELNGMPSKKATTRSLIETNDIYDCAVIHATFVGFYGDWTKAPALEAYDFRDIVDVENMLNLVGYSELGYKWYHLNGFGDQVVGYNEGYGYDPMDGLYFYLGGNPFTLTDNEDNQLAYNEDHISFSSLIDAYFAGGWSYVNEFVTAPTQLRNCRHLIMTVTDADTGEVYYVDDTEFLSKAKYDSDYGIYTQLGTFGWDGTDADGYTVPSGTRVNVEYTTEIDYEGAEPKLEWSFGVDVDYDLPTIVDGSVSFDAETRLLSFDITDENFLAYISIADENEDELYWNGYSSETRGDVERIVLDLRDVASETVTISIVDYATNQSDYEIDTPLLETSTIESLRNRNSGEGIYVRGLVHHIDGETIYVQSPNDEVAEGNSPWGLTLDVTINEMGKDVEVGQVCYIWLPPSAVLGLSPESCVSPFGLLLYSIEKIEPEDIITTKVYSTADVTDRLMATMIEIPAEVDTDKANIMLTVEEDMWTDGSGYQLLLDVDCDTYGDTIPPVGPITTVGPLSQAAYDRFEYILPLDPLTGGSAELEIPQGIYDWVVINPADDRVWIAAGGRGDDFAIDAGYTYEWSISMNGTNDQVELIKTDWSGNSETTVLREKKLGTRSIDEPILRETFADLTAWTQIDADGDGNIWKIREDITVGHNTPDDGFVISESYINDVGALTPDNWLVSQKVDLTGVTDPYVGFRFYVAAQDANWPDEVFGVYVSEAGNTDTADFVEVYSAKMSASGPIVRDTTAWYEVEVDLSAYIGKEIYVAFRHFDCTDCFYLNIDDVTLYSDTEAPDGPTPPPPPPPIDAGDGLAWTAASLDGWTQIDADGDGNVWYLLGPDDGNGFPGHGAEADGQASSASYAGGALTPDNWLVSPAVDLTTEGLQSAKLSFWVQSQDAAYAGEVFGVYVSKTGNTDTADFESVYDAEMSATGPVLRETTAWFNVEIDMTDYLGETIYVAFRHYDCEDEFRLNLDDVYLTTSEESNEQPFPQMPYGLMIGDLFDAGEGLYNGFLIDEYGKLYFGENDIPMILNGEGELVKANLDTEFIPTSYMAGRFSLVDKNANGYVIHNNADDTLITEVGNGLPIVGLFNLSFTLGTTTYYINGANIWRNYSFSENAQNAANVIITQNEDGNWLIRVGNYYLRDASSTSDGEARITTDINQAVAFTFDKDKGAFEVVGTNRYLQLRHWTEGSYIVRTYTSLYLVAETTSTGYSMVTNMTLIDLAA